MKSHKRQTRQESPGASTGTIGHVITFAAVRRTMAVGALWTAGIKDFDAADPRPWLDSLGIDAGQRSNAARTLSSVSP